jgi:hypothetical protein
MHDHRRHGAVLADTHEAVLSYEVRGPGRTHLLVLAAAAGTMGVLAGMMSGLSGAFTWVLNLSMLALAAGLATLWSP